MGQQEHTEATPQLPPRPQEPLTSPQLAAADEMATTALQDTPSAVTPAAGHPNAEPEVADTPEIATLKAMFPDFDSGLL